MFDQPVPIFSFLFKTRRTQSTNYPISDTIIFISQYSQCCQYSCPDPDSYPDILINRRSSGGQELNATKSFLELPIVFKSYQWISKATKSYQQATNGFQKLPKAINELPKATNKIHSGKSSLGLRKVSTDPPALYNTYGTYYYITRWD